jgi:hypothetical protein
MPKIKENKVFISNNVPSNIIDGIKHIVVSPHMTKMNNPFVPNTL